MQSGYKTVTCEICGLQLGKNWYVRHMKAKHPNQILQALEQIPLPPEEDREVLGGLLLVVVAAARRKAFAGLDYASGGQHQDYPPAVVGVGVARDAIDMIVVDIMKFIKANL